MAIQSQRWTWLEWQKIARNHLLAATSYTHTVRLRRDYGEPHPVEDFLFRYYPYPIALLEQWQPAVGVELEILDLENLAPRFLTEKYRIEGKYCRLDPYTMSVKERERLLWIQNLLEATQSHVPFFSCHGMHEWAMVYKGEQIRHGTLAPLRLAQKEIDLLIESRPIFCTHHDAFRFFSRQAKPFNRIQPSLDTRNQNEQPGCVHANMDLYKWGAKSMPWIGSELFFEIFQLAVKLRDLDMRASPYDLSKWGLEPIKIETTDGRRDYETIQRDLAAKATALRETLISALQVTLAAK